MYRPILILLLCLVGGCTKEQKGYTQKEFNKNVDSLFQSKLPLIEQHSKEDFKNRFPIEFKTKMDSILNISYDIPTAPELYDPINPEIPNTDDSSVAN